MNLSYDQAEVGFDSLIKNVLACTKCSRMCNSQRVLNRSSGSTSADIMFVGEAPGRLGADGTGIPFHGDKSGHNFEELLHFAGLSRTDIFITNAVLCNPKDENGNNATPTQTEIKNCSEFLQKQIELVNPKIIVTLGASPLAALKNVMPHDIELKHSVRTKIHWFKRILIPLYHPGQRAMISRSFANQRSDYQFVAEQIKQISKKKKKLPSSKPQLNVALIIDYLFSKKSSFTYFALHKLFYLIEYKSVQQLGDRLTNSYIIRQKDGPYCTELHLFKLQKALPYIKTKNLSKTNILLFRLSTSLFDERLIDQYEIDETAKEVIDLVLEEHGEKSNAALKRTVYFTRPMRNILKLELTERINLYNTAIEF